MLVAIPSGVQMFAWAATVLESNGRPRFEPPMMWAIGFVVLFLIGGVTGVMVGVVPFDLQVTDSYFVVAHFHYVLIGGSVFPIFAGLHLWVPKITGRMYHRGVAILAFWLAFVGMNLTFFVHHFLGMAGMPRRVYTYVPETGWQAMNQLSTVGAFILAAGFVLAIANLARTGFRGPDAGPNPWNAESLEWATSSPPPDHNFDAFPVVSSSAPLWEREERGREEQGGGLQVVRRVGDEDVTQPLHGHHRTLLSSVLDADRVEMTTMPGPSTWPFVVALSILGISVGLIARSWAVGIASTVVLCAAVIWWHTSTEHEKGEAG
jgi:heme/copper-type cytochrome/quinol oxidase subunit 1